MKQVYAEIARNSSASIDFDRRTVAGIFPKKEHFISTKRYTEAEQKRGKIRHIFSGNAGLLTIRRGNSCSVLRAFYVKLAITFRALFVTGITKRALPMA